MDKRGANIDLVFRNGLKDIEVLPPPEVWDNILPVIKTRPGKFIFLRVAAMIAVIISLSFLAYIMTREVSTVTESIAMANNEDVATPGISSPADRYPDVRAKGVSPLGNSPKIIIENIGESAAIPENEKTASPEVADLQKTNSLMANINQLLKGTGLIPLNNLQKRAYRISEPEQQYLPEKSKINITDRWSIGAMASPTYYSRFNSGNDEISKQLMASEQSLISYSGGLSFAYKINKRVSIQSGLYYSSLGQQVDGINSFGGFQKYNNTKGGHNFEVLTSNGTVYTNNADVFLIASGSGERIQTAYTNDVFDPEKASLQYINNTLHQNFSYLELPIILRYKIVDQMIDFNLIGGVSYNLLVSNSVYTMVEGGKYPIGKTEGLNPVSLSSSLGMGMEYNFSKNLSLNLEPTFRYYLNPFNEVTGSKNHPYSFGIFSGISYKF